MRKIFTGVLILCSLAMFLALMPVLQAWAADTETFEFVNESPRFTLTIPKGTKSTRSRNPNSVLRMAYDADEVLVLEVSVSDLPVGYSYKKDAVMDLKDFLEEKYKGSNFETLYEREIKLKDGTPAYEFELRWDHPLIRLYSYNVIAFKNKKLIRISVGNGEQIIEKYKQYPLSLTFK